LGAGEGARVNCFELEVGAGLDGGEVLFFDEDAYPILLTSVYGLVMRIHQVILLDLPLPIMATPMG
jgi:hypothetical protein